MMPVAYEESLNAPLGGPRNFQVSYTDLGFTVVTHRMDPQHVALACVASNARRKLGEENLRRFQDGYC